MTAKILIVDDSRLIRAQFGDMLRRSGHEVIEAADAAGALAAAPRADLILLDVVLPDCSGIELCRQLRQRPETRFLPIVLVTALADRRHRVAGIEVGADDFLNKPVDETEMLARVASLLRIKSQRDEMARMKNDMAASLVHDLRSPVASIIGFACVLRDNLAPEQHDEFLGRIEAIGQRMLRHINGLLDVSRLESGCQTISPTPTDLSVLLHDLASDLQPQAQSRGVTLSVHAATSLKATVDPVGMRLVLMNLIDNALKFAKSQVLVQGFGTDGQVHVTIGDDGPGVPEAELPLLWERWRQTGSGRRQGQGSGLGLAIAKGLIEAHEGTIGARNRDSGGLVIRLQLPAARASRRPPVPQAGPPLVTRRLGAA